MAEIFGVVASAFALLHLSNKVRRTLRDVSDIDDKFEDLCTEIKSINDWVRHAGSTLSSAEPIRNQLDRTETKLKKIATDLEEIESKVTKDLKNGGHKARKLKWLNKSGKIKELLETARYAKTDLALAVQWQQHVQISRIEARSDKILQHSIRGDQILSTALSQITVIANNLPPRDVPPGEQQSRVEELPDDETEPQEQGASQRSFANGQGQVSADDMNEVGDREMTTSPAAPNRGVMVSATLVQQIKPSCPDDCRCGCHRGSGLSQKTGRMSGLLGYMGVRFDMPSWGGQGDARCKCLGSWSVAYRPPWLRARVLILSGICHAGCPSVSLRAARVVPWTDVQWNHVQHSAQAVQHSIQRGAMFYPDDHSETGQEMTEYVIKSQRLDVLEFLLTQWKNVLSQRGLSKRAGWAANALMQSRWGALDEGHLSLLQQVIFFAEGDHEVTTSRVHEAARAGRGMAEALREDEDEDGWAKDALDNTGRAPLHWAVENDYVEAVRQLIQSGADVNIADMDGQSPLSVAALMNRTTCMRLLLDAGCRIEQCSMGGMTALHWAAQYGSADAVQLLLDAEETKTRKMATATEHTFVRVPLHELALSLRNGATPEAVEEIARLLLEAHPEGIESLDIHGLTPLLLALYCDNLPLVRCLSRRGASWAVVSTRTRWNLMHHATDCCSAAILDFLLEEAKCSEEKLHHIDHQLRSDTNNSPWDMFTFNMYAPPWLLGDSPHHDKDNRAAFVKFYRHVRDKNILHDINTLQNALHAWSGNGAETARDHLLRLAARKAAAHNQGASNYYRGITNQLLHGDQHAAVETMEQDLQDLNDELQSSPWHQTSGRDYVAEKSQWIEFPNHSFWIEPADSFVLQDEDGADGQFDNNEGSHTQQNDYLDNDPAFVSGGLSLDYARIARIHSERGQLLYDHEKHHGGAMQFLKSHVGDAAIDKARFSRPLVEWMVRSERR